jgi:hypothetical protein
VCYPPAFITAPWFYPEKKRKEKNNCSLCSELWQPPFLFYLRIIVVKFILFDGLIL